MSENVERRALGLAVVFFRHLAGRYQRELSDLTGIDQKRISRYELGEVEPGRLTLERFARGTRVTSERLDQLLALFRTICSEVEAESLSGEPAAMEDPSESERREDLDEIAAEIAESLKPDFYDALLLFEANLAAVEKPPLAPQAARELAAELCQRLLPLPNRIRLQAIEFDEYRNWAVCERLCEESFEAAASDPANARALADVALTIAENLPGSETSRHRLMAYALVHAAKADAGLGEIEEANEKMRQARELWRAGDATDDLDDEHFATFLVADS